MTFLFRLSFSERSSGCLMRLAFSAGQALCLGWVTTTADACSIRGVIAASIFWTHWRLARFCSAGLISKQFPVALPKRRCGCWEKAAPQNSIDCQRLEPSRVLLHYAMEDSM